MRFEGDNMDFIQSFYQNVVVTSGLTLKSVKLNDLKKENAYNDLGPIL